PPQAGDVDQLRRTASLCLGDLAGLEPALFEFPEEVRSVALRPDGKSLAAGLADGTVTVRELQLGRETARLAGHPAAVAALLFTPDGQRLISGDVGGTIHVWEAGEGGWNKRSFSIGVPDARTSPPAPLSLALTPDGRYLLACPRGGETITMWDLS